MKFLKILSWCVKGLILVLLLFVALLNTQTVQFTYLPEQAWNLPLIVVVFGGFVIGTVFGIFATFGRILRLRSENNRLRNEVQKTARLSTQDITAPVASTEVATTEAKK